MPPPPPLPPPPPWGSLVLLDRIWVKGQPAPQSALPYPLHLLLHSTIFPHSASHLFPDMYSTTWSSCSNSSFFLCHRNPHHLPISFKVLRWMTLAIRDSQPRTSNGEKLQHSQQQQQLQQSQRQQQEGPWQKEAFVFGPAVQKNGMGIEKKIFLKKSSMSKEQLFDS